MHLKELLLHVAGNIEKGRGISDGLHYRGEKSRAGNRIEEINFKDFSNYAVSPKTVLVNGLKVTSGTHVKPEKGKVYYAPALDQPDMVNAYTWHNDDIDNERLFRGLVFHTFSGALEMAKAMLSTKRVQN